MAQAKKKTATKTAKKATARKTTQSRKKACTRTTKCRDISTKEKMHIYVVTALGMIAGILLCADAAMLMVR